jgi:prepilin-type N-terminal cleavage/methylation domain-containing protein
LQEHGVDQRGFTLLEIAVTTAIVALILAIAVPRLPRLGRTDLEASGSWTDAAISPFADTTDPKPSSAFQQRPTTAFQEVEDDPLARTVALPAGISFDAILDRDGETRAGEWPVYFLPEGLSENLGVRLRDDESGERVTVRLDAAQGRASLDEIVEVAP